MSHVALSPTPNGSLCELVTPTKYRQHGWPKVSFNGRFELHG
jgi:hypothetical protein